MKIVPFALVAAAAPGWPSTMRAPPSNAGAAGSGFRLDTHSSASTARSASKVAVR